MKKWRLRKRRRRKNDLSPIALLIFALVLIRAYAAYFVTFGALVLIGWLIVRLSRAYKLRNSGLQDVDQMDPFRFEDYVGELFRMKGYRTEVTKRSGDFGADVIALDSRGQRTAIQVKHSSIMRAVGPRAVQEVVAAKSYYRCTKAIVITNADFTEGANKLARVNRVDLWNRDRLANEMLSLRRIYSSSPLAILAPAGIGILSDEPKLIPETETCMLCGKKMVARNGKYGPFLGCTGYPECRYTTKQ